MNIGDFAGYEKKCKQYKLQVFKCFQRETKTQITIYQIIKNFKQHQCNRKDNIGHNQ